MQKKHVCAFATTPLILVIARDPLRSSRLSSAWLSLMEFMVAVDYRFEQVTWLWHGAALPAIPQVFMKPAFLQGTDKSERVDFF